MTPTKNVVPLLAGAFIFSGCSTQPPLPQALDKNAIATVQADIKRQVGVYMRAARKSGVPSGTQFWCGSGKIDFDISSVKAQLTTSIETATNAGLKLKIPVDVITIGPSGNEKVDVTNTQSLTYNLWPLVMSQQSLDDTMPTTDELKGAPIAQVLMDLRDALIASATQKQKGPQPCFTDYNPEKPSSDAGNTITLALSFVNDANAGVEVDVGILGVTATGELKGTTGNTLTVSFVQKGLDAIQRAKDKVDAECKYPKYGSKPCTNAIAELQKLQKEGSGILFQTQ